MSSQSHRPEQTLRASDTDREQTVSSLRAHHAAGRLQTDELDQRIAGALTAATVTELDDHLRDLPHLRAEQRSRVWGTQRVMIVAVAVAVAVAVTAAIAAATAASALSGGVHLIWILPLLWFAGPWHRRWIPRRRGPGREAAARSQA
jgi:Flp pilus assembly protein TadB